MWALCFLSCNVPRNPPPKKKNTLKPSEASSNGLIGSGKEEKGSVSDEDRLNRTAGDGDEGTNQANDIIRGEIRWPETRVQKFELWNYVWGVGGGWWLSL